MRYVNRLVATAAGIATGRPSSWSATSAAEPGPSEMPQAQWPAAIALRAAALDRERRGGADVQLRAGGARPLREGGGRGGGRDRTAGLVADGGQAGCERRLGGGQLGAAERLRRELREALGGRRRGRVAEDQQPARRGRQREAVPELAVVRQRGLVERDQLGVERVLHDARVASRRARRDPLALVQLDRRARLGEERRQRAADDAAADDDERVAHRGASAAASACGVFRLATIRAASPKRASSIVAGASAAIVARSDACAASAARSAGSSAGS